MTFRGRSDGLVVESNRKENSFSRRQCVAPIALKDKPPMNYIVEMNSSLQNIRWGVNISGISSVACWVCDCVCVWGGVEGVCEQVMQVLSRLELLTFNNA